MTHPKEIAIADYSYTLPDEFIAHYPLAERDASRLLVYRHGDISEDIYRNIGEHLPENALLVFNNTKVVEARILFRKPTGAQIEIFCLEPPPEYGGIAAAMARQGKVQWKCLVGGASKWKPGQMLVRSIERVEVVEPGQQDTATPTGQEKANMTSQTPTKATGRDTTKTTKEETTNTTSQDSPKTVEQHPASTPNQQPATATGLDSASPTHQHPTNTAGQDPAITASQSTVVPTLQQPATATGPDSAAPPPRHPVAPTDQHAAVPTGRDALTLQVRYVDKLEDSFLIEFSWEPAHLTFAELLHRVGQIPLPPYIKRPAETSDQERYQTVYARHDGSVAAPTAGLHFTESIFQSLAAKNIQREFVTLHVGAGTFMPVKSPTMEQHVMHVEYISVTKATLEKLRSSLKGAIIAVGTTSSRTLESLYWLGVKTIREPAIAPEDLVVQQWDAYAGSEPNSTDSRPNENLSPGLADSRSVGITPGSVSISPEAALASLSDWLDRQGLSQLLTRTQLLITPGYEWKIVRGLITNFHQPESTLLLLVASLIGKDWKKVYEYALEHEFRFLSYGDGSLLLRPT